MNKKPLFTAFKFTHSVLHGIEVGDLIAQGDLYNNISKRSLDRIIYLVNIDFEKNNQLKYSFNEAYKIIEHLDTFEYLGFDSLSEISWPSVLINIQKSEH